MKIFFKIFSLFIALLMTLSASIGCYNNELFRNDYKKQRVYRGIVYENGEGNYTPIGRTVSMKQIVNKPVNNEDVNSLLKWNDVESKSQKELTIMIYMVGSNLESNLFSQAASRDLNEMLNSKLDDRNVNVVVYCGGASVWWNGLSSQTNSYLVYSSKNNGTFDVYSDEKRNMGESETFADFLNTTYEKFPAEKYSLICWDHGGGPYLGYGNDENYQDSNNMPDCLTISEMKDALDKTPFKENKLEFVGFDACLMSTLEVADLWKDYSNCLLASPETEAGCGWDYTFLNTLNNSLFVDDITSSIIDYYSDYIEISKTSDFNPDYSLISFDLNRIDKVEKAMNDLFKTINQNFNENIVNVLYLKQSSKFYGGEEEYEIIDLGDFSYNAKEIFPDSSKNVISALSNCIIYGKTNILRCKGMSFYLPFSCPEIYSTFGHTILESNEYAPEFVSFIDKIVNEIWQEDISDSYKMMKPDLSEDEKIEKYQLTDNQIKSFASAYYTVLKKVDNSNTYIPIIENIPATLDNSNNLLVDLDPELIGLQTSDNSLSFETHFKYLYKDDTSISYQSINTAFGSSLEHMPIIQHQFAKYNIKADNTGVTIKSIEKEDEKETNTNAKINLSGKGDISTKDFRMTYFSWTNIPKFVNGDYSKPYYDSKDSSTIFAQFRFDEEFKFVAKKLSEIENADNLYYQLIVRNKDGKEYALAFSKFPNYQDYKTVTQKTAKGEMTFRLYKDYAILDKYNGADKIVIVPEKVDNKKVTEIAEQAFTDIMVTNSEGTRNNLEEIKLPETITEIHDSAFEALSVLEKINIPSGITDIAYSLFKDDIKLTNIDFPENIKTIGAYAFFGTGIEKFNISKNVTSIGAAAFSNCSKLKDLTIASENKNYTIEDNVLFTKNMKELISFCGQYREEYVVPDGVEKIGEAAFEYSGNVNDIVVDDEKNYKGLRKITFPNSLKVIDQYAFYECLTFKTINLPRNLEYIGSYAFGASYFYVVHDGMTINIGEDVNYIGYAAFSAFDKLNFNVNSKNSKFRYKNGKLTNLSGEQEINYYGMTDGERNQQYIKKPNEL